MNAPKQRGICSLPATLSHALFSLLPVNVEISLTDRTFFKAKSQMTEIRKETSRCLGAAERRENYMDTAKKGQ